MPINQNTPPTLDLDGSVTGAQKRYYYYVNFGNSSPSNAQAASADTADCVDNWYVETTFLWEGVESTFRVCMFVERLAPQGGFLIPQEFTPYIYCTPEDIRQHLLLNKFIDSNSDVRKDFITTKIIQFEGEFDRRTGQSFRKNFKANEVHDARALRERHHDLYDNFISRIQVELKQKPLIMPFDSSRGHKIEVFEGTENPAPTVAKPLGEWTRWDLKTMGRNADWWVDPERGHITIRKYIIRAASLVRVSYEWGKPITQTTQDIGKDDTTIPIQSNYGYSPRGVKRIGDEYIYTAAFDDTTLYVAQRGLFGTKARAHPAGAEVYEVPDDIRNLMTAKVAASFLENEWAMGMVPEGMGSTPDNRSKVDRWNREWEEAITGRYQKWRLV